MKKILFLDDDLFRQRSIVRWAKLYSIDIETASNLEGFKKHLQYSGFDIIFFDSNLGFELGTEAVDILIEERYTRLVFCVVHSSDPVGAQNIAGKLLGAGFRTMTHPFGNQFWFEDCLAEMSKTITTNTVKDIEEYIVGANRHNLV